MKKNGFTLVEMLLVIALIATITAIIIPNITSSIDTSKEEKYNSYVKLLEENLEMYKTDLNITDNKTLTFKELKSRVSEINIGECDAKELEIKKDSNDKFSYYACIKCDDGKYYSSKELGTDSCK